MDLKEIKQIIDLMKRSDLTELEVEQEGLKLRICRGAGGQFSASSNAVSAPSNDTAHPPAPPAAPAPGPEAPPTTEVKLEEGVVLIRSPMVGTFYRSAAPDVPPFVEVNQKVAEDSVICIIEAMKVMNEIQAEVKGTVVEVLVESGQPVEYGQPLFKVKKS